MNLLDLSKQAGFAEAFLLPNASYPVWTRHRKDGAFHSNADILKEDPNVSYPWANVCLICVWAYKPYDDPSVLAAYYPASNAAYHAMSGLLKHLNAHGVRAERADTPFRTQLLAAGIGSKMDNQLWYYPPYGTYVHLEGAMLSLPEPVSFTPPSGNEPACDHCGACERCCMGALRSGEFHWQECIRSYMENQPMPEKFMGKLHTLMGCQSCQDNCPKNPKDRVPVPEEIRRALDPLEIVKGNVRPALGIVGKNKKKHLIRQSIILCANRRIFEALPYLEALSERDNGTFQSELAYATKLLQNEKNMVE